MEEVCFFTSLTFFYIESPVLVRVLHSRRTKIVLVKFDHFSDKSETQVQPSKILIIRFSTGASTTRFYFQYLQSNLLVLNLVD